MVSAIWTSPAGSRREIFYDGRPVIDSHHSLSSFIDARLGAKTGSIFATPLRQADGSILWSDGDGVEPSVPLASLPEGDKAAVRAQLRATLARILAACDEPAQRSLLLACLTLDGPDAIRVRGGGDVVLAGWGAVPASLATPEQLSRHHAATLGPVLDDIDPPRFALVDRALAAPVRAGPGGWRGLLAATLVAGALLLALLLPQVLRGYVASDPVDYGAANAALEQQIAAINGALRGNVCATAPATPRLRPAPPEGRRSERDRTAPGTGGREPAAPTPPIRPADVPVPPETLTNQPSGAQNLAAFLNRSTVLIATSTGTGSGFFVTRDHILTNRHVIEDANPTLLVGNKLLGRMLPAELVGKSDSSEVFEPDYALLKLRSSSSETFLPFAANLPYQLENVIASGFPGIVLKTDAAFERLEQGDVRAVPDSALTAGAVVVVQSTDTPAPVILHRASISPGNSGGPLADECGRVVGINTFVRGSSGADDRMNYSLAAPSAIAFLKRFGVTPTVVPGSCTTAAAGESGRSAPPAGPPPAVQPNGAPPAPAGPSAGQPSRSGDR